MENWKEKCRKLTKTCFEGEVTIRKTSFWLVGTVCLLSGIVYGLVAAPWTHGVEIACNNGNNENYYTGRGDEEEAE